MQSRRGFPQKETAAAFDQDALSLDWMRCMRA